MRRVLIVDSHRKLPDPGRPSVWDGLVADLARYDIELHFRAAPQNTTVPEDPTSLEDAIRLPEEGLVVLGADGHEETRQMLATSWSAAGRSVVLVSKASPPIWVPLAAMLARQVGTGEVVPAGAHEVQAMILRHFGITEEPRTFAGLQAWTPGAVPSMCFVPGPSGIPLYLWQAAVTRHTEGAAYVNVSQALSGKAEQGRHHYALFRLQTGQGIDGLLDRLHHGGLVKVALEHLHDEDIARHRSPLEDAVTASLVRQANRDVPVLDGLRGHSTCDLTWRSDDLELAFLAGWRGIQGRGVVAESLSTIRDWWNINQHVVHADMVGEARVPTPPPALGRRPQYVLWNLLRHHLPVTSPDPLIEDGFYFGHPFTWHLAACHRSAPEVVRAALRAFPGRTWSRTDMRDALRSFVAASPPTSTAEAEAWGSLAHETRSRGALLTVARGIAWWPWLPGPAVAIAEMYHHRGGDYVSHLLPDLGWRVLLEDGDDGYQRTEDLAIVEGARGHHVLVGRQHEMTGIRRIGANLGSFDLLPATVPARRR